MEKNFSPYIVGLPVSQPDQFFGRQYHIDQFFSRVRNSSLLPMHICGLRRSGKTSFLKHVADRSIWNANLTDDDRPLIIANVNLQYIDGGPPSFFQLVSRKVFRAAYAGLDLALPQELSDSITFGDWIIDILARNERLRIIVLLDEFEMLTQDRGFEESFFIHLRALATDDDLIYRFTWVIASCDELYSLADSMSKPNGTSPFFNIFHPESIILGGMQLEEAEELISLPAQSAGLYFTYEQIVKIRKLAGHLPYFIQWVAEQWYLGLKHGLLSEEIEKQIFSNLNASNQSIPKQMNQNWKRLTARERNLLYASANERLDRFSPEVAQKLQRYGLLIEDNGQIQISGEIFRQWIKNKKRKQVMEPTDIAPYIPIIVEATKFVTQEAGKLLDEIRKKRKGVDEDKSYPIIDLKTLNKIQASVHTRLNSQRILEQIDNVFASENAYEIEQLLVQIKLHKRNRIDLETQEAREGHDPRFSRRIEDEEDQILKKTDRLVDLLKKIYKV
jgi:hypothetical protein